MKQSLTLKVVGLNILRHLFQVLSQIVQRFHSLSTSDI
jgi:hypothetical protein